MSDTICQVQDTYSLPTTNGIQISLVIPCYNVPEEQITRALASVDKQTFQSYEVIIVDDGSREAFARLLRTLCEGKEKTTLVRTDNRGVSAARNTGIAFAKGKYTAFLDADDVLAKDFMERAWQTAEKTAADFVIGGTTIISTPDIWQPAKREDPVSYSLFDETTRMQLCQHMMGPQFIAHFYDGYIGRGPWARLVRTRLVKDILFDPELKYGEDIVWNLQVILRSQRICVVKESWYGYWENSVSITHRYHEDFIQTCEKQFEKIKTVVDLSDPLIYASYISRIYENLYMCWTNCLRFVRDQNKEAYYADINHIYSSWPWREIGTPRAFTILTGKRKFGVLLFRSHLYFSVKAVKDGFLRIYHRAQ